MSKISVTMAMAVAVGLLAACSAGDSAGPEDEPTTTSTSAPTSPGPAASSTPTGATDDPPTSAPDTAAGTDGDIPEGCDLTDRRVQILARDWERVVGSIGREDHSTYTGALAREMDGLQKRSTGCPGAKDLQRFITLVDRIDAGSAKPDLALYPQAVKAGDAWLRSLGFENLRLAPS